MAHCATLVKIYGWSVARPHCHEFANALGHLFPFSHTNVLDKRLHQLANPAVYRALFCHHYSRLHHCQNTFWRSVCISFPDIPCKFRVPRFKGLLIASKCVDQTLRIISRVNICNHLRSVSLTQLFALTHCKIFHALHLSYLFRIYLRWCHAHHRRSRRTTHLTKQGTLHHRPAAHKLFGCFWINLSLHILW